MARGTSFLTLTDMLKDEIGLSTNVGIGIDDMSALKRHINRGYELCYDAHDWAHLRIKEPRIALSAGQYLYDFPTSIGFERTESITAYMGSMPYVLEKGISYPQYSVFDTENDVRSDPAMRWDIRWSGTAPQIEIWPIPASSDQELEIIGLKKFVRLVEDEDICVLDDELVVLAAAIRPVKRADSKDGDILAAEFQDRMAQMKKRAAPGSRVVMGGAGDKQFRGVTLSVTGRA